MAFPVVGAVEFLELQSVEPGRVIQQCTPVHLNLDLRPYPYGSSKALCL